MLEGLAEWDLFGASLSVGSDFNGDGHPDLLIGAIGVDINDSANSGQVYILLGTSNISNAFDDYSLPSSLNGKNGFHVDGKTSY